VAAKYDYSAIGAQRIVELLAVEHAVVWPEVEAKLADRQWTGPPFVIHPGHLTEARGDLLRRGVITEIRQRTRGGRVIPVLMPTDQWRRRRAVEDAAARKRLLQTRYLTWASGSAGAGAGVIGAAGERVVHDALTAAAPHGYRLINPQGGEVRRLLGAPVPGGAPDNGAFLTTVDAHTLTPTGQFIVLVEVKNIRSWIYPSAAELHQLLDKAARLQQQHPDRRFVPVLVCRRSHYLTNKMAEQLGFYVIATKRQYVPSGIAGTDLDEVRDELAYDLEPYTETPPTPLVAHFTTTLQGVAERTAQRWVVSAAMRPYFGQLREDRLPRDDRAAIHEELRDAAERQHGTKPWW
jgi:hypothetical protein